MCTNQWTRAAFPVFCGLGLLVLAGCAAPTEAERAGYAAAQTRIAGLISDFGEAVSKKDAAAAAAVLGPQVSPTDRAVAQVSFREAVWLRTYTGYKPDAQKAAARLSWRRFRKGLAALDVAATNAEGQTLTDRYMFVRHAGNWELAGVSLQQPVTGADLDLPAAEAEKIRAVVKPVMLAIRNDTFTRIMTALPPERDAHYRTTELSFWDKLLDAEAQEYSLYYDLELVRQFEVLHWPDFDKELPLAFLGPTYVAACYDIPYTWPQGGVDRPDTLRIRVFVISKQDKWYLHRLRLYGKGIPGTE